MRIEEIQNELPKYKETFSDQFGRYLIAGKKLSPGEVILREKPVVVGPANFNKNSLCFNCLRILPNISIIEIKFKCEICKIAIFCNSACQNRKSHHTSEECATLKKSKNLKNLNLNEFSKILLPLRFWLIQKIDKNLWEKILKLESHLEKRKGTSVWKNRQETVTNVLKKFEIISENDDDIFQKICGIIDVNSFELRSPGTLDNSPLRGLYSQAALMSHDCRGNTHLTVDDDFNLTIYASTSIEQNQPILFNYTSSLLGTLERRNFLREGKYFYCHCQMCQHPQELGAHLSSIICPRCKKGFLELKNFDKPFVREKIWFCQNCNHQYSGKLIKTTLDLAQKLIIETDKSNAKDLEKLIEKLTFTFHSHHSFLLNIKQKLLGIYRNDLTSVHPQKKILKRILEICREFLEVLEIVEPGISRFKGMILYEMHLPIVLLANRNYTAREISSEELSNKLEEALNYLKKSLSMLLLEPPTTPEGILAKRALQEYKTLRKTLEDVKSLPSESKTTISKK